MVEHFFRLIQECYCSLQYSIEHDRRLQNKTIYFGNTVHRHGVMLERLIWGGNTHRTIDSFGLARYCCDVVYVLSAVQKFVCPPRQP